jgi:hypothetical protein
MIFVYCAVFNEMFLCCSVYFLCCSMYRLFCDVPCVVCVYMCTEQLPPGAYPIAVKYEVYHIKIAGRAYRCVPSPKCTENRRFIVNVVVVCSR